MKKIYTLIALTLGMCSAVSAQKVIDLETTVISPAASSTITVGQPFALKVAFKNKGTGAIAPSDTLFFAFTGSSSTYYITGKTKAVNDTIYLNTQLTFTAAPNGSFNFCVVGLEANGNTIIDSDTSNNKNCKQVTITGGTSGVAEVVFSENVTKQQMNVFPNPSNGIVNFDYVAVNESEVTAHVFDMAGREVIKQSFGKAYRGKTGFRLDMSALNEGMYFIELRQEGIRTIGKVNKQ